VNVEHNKLIPLLKQKWHFNGDTQAKSGFSSFAGNTNTLVIKLEEYVNVMDAKSGIIPEYMNPIY
jgi:hypothetical protein